MEQKEHRLLNLAEAAEYLGITRRGFAWMVDHDQVMWVQIGKRKLVSTAQLDRILEAKHE